MTDCTALAAVAGAPMEKPMTYDLVKRADEALKDVTPGPWRVGPVDDCRVEDADGNEVAQIDGDYNQPETWPLMEANARFIANARELVPAMRDRIEADAKRIAELETEVGRSAKDYDVARAFHDLAVGERNRARELNVALESRIEALTAERDAMAEKLEKAVEAVEYILDGMAIDGPDYKIDPDDDFLDAANSDWVRDTLTRLAATLAELTGAGE